MGKVHDEIGARGNHKRQRQQNHLILHGWRPTWTGAAHDDHGHLWKDAFGQCCFNAVSDPGLHYIEWDDVPTPRVQWIYNNLLGRRLI